MSSLKAVQKKLNQLETEKQSLKTIELGILRRKLIKCTNCLKKSPIQNWVLLKAMHYIPPRGCTEGDYWLHSGTEVSDLVCPKCNYQLYIYNHPDRDKIVALIDDSGFDKAQLFKEVRDNYKK